MPAALEVKNLNLWYGDHQALHNINMEVPANRITALIGPSGCGKSTFLKTLNRMELLSRIRALLRRTAPDSGEYRIGGLTVVPSKHIVQADGADVTLTQKEFELLCLLMRNPGIVFSREQLIEQVWGYAFTGETRTVDVHGTEARCAAQSSIWEPERPGRTGFWRCAAPGPRRRPPG
jgi:Response regulators consisting of a CheY-like receiver domain and a winged-helix DNA-binding domain